MALAVFYASRTIRELTPGRTRNRWQLLRVLIVLFIAGYLSYWASLPRSAGLQGVIAGVVFFLNADFVIVVCMLALQTVQDVKRLAILEQESITDSIVGIYNRRYLDKRLREELERAKRHKLPLSLLLMDIDNFKQVNDLYGHTTGDVILGEIGRVLQERVRVSDLAARYGGDELAVLLPNTRQDGAALIAERIRSAMERTPVSGVKDVNGDVHFTISTGVGSALENDTGTELLRRTDLALYHAKQKGRNQVVNYVPEFEARKPAS